jgi:hypothetical protein
MEYESDTGWEESLFLPPVKPGRDGMIHGSRRLGEKAAESIGGYGSDTQEMIERCEACPFQKCKNSAVCMHRLGIEQRKEEQPPAGYDEVKLDQMLPHAYTYKELADALEISVYRAKKWCEWRFRKK